MYSLTTVRYGGEAEKERGGKKTTFCTTNEAQYSSLPSCTSLKKKKREKEDRSHSESDHY